MKDYDKNKGSSYLKHWGVNSLHLWKIPQKFNVNDFEWSENISGDKSFRKSYNEESDEEYFLELDIQHP